MPYLVGPVVVLLGVAHDEQRRHGHAVEEPGREAEEVDEAVDVAWDNHQDRDQALKGKQ